MTDDDELRLDKWLWAARFYKTRSLATTAVRAGHVDVNGERPKPARLLVAGDRVAVRRGPLEMVVVVRTVEARRGSAAVAALMYDEEPAARALRLETEAHLRAEARSGPRYGGRPGKRDRRALLRLKAGPDDATPGGH